MTFEPAAHCATLPWAVTDMQFVVEGVSGEGVRLGRLLGARHAQLGSPLCLLYCRTGALPHLTSDLAQTVLSEPSAAMLPLPSIYKLPGLEVMEKYSNGIHSFFGLQGHMIYLPVQDPHCPPPCGYNENKTTSIWTSDGRNKVTVVDHLRLVSACQPTFFQALCDRAPPLCSLKRTQKAVDRTLQFLDATLEARRDSEALQGCGVLGVVEGGGEEEERRRSAEQTARRPVDGFVLQGFSSLPLQEDLLRVSVEQLPRDKPRFMHGLRALGEVFCALEAGVDVFDSSCAFSATEGGRALVFANSTLCREPCPFQISLTEDQYERDFSPLVAGCRCYTCRAHTRAYLHHLLATREMLAASLLMLHNFTHYLDFFAGLREALRTSHYAQFKATCLSLTTSSQL